MIDKSTKFLIVGLGLIGGSYARALKKAGVNYVAGIDINPDSIGYALNQHIIDEGSIVVDEELIKKVDVIILGLYPVMEIKWLKENQHLINSNTLITDVSGIKQKVIGEIHEFLREDLELISCHPMAGREVSGVRNADEKIFEKANFIVVDTERNTKQAIDDAIELGALLGFEKISRLSAKKHDEIIGFVSQLTHVIAISLMTCNEDEDLQKYTGDSFRDLTRIARINENMWSELFIENGDTLIEQIDDFTNQMNYIKEMIQNKDTDGLKKVMIKSTARRALFDK